MFDRYTRAAERGVFEARLAAAKVGARQLTAMHLMIGWLKAPVDPVTPSLADRVRRELLASLPPGPSETLNPNLPLARDAYGALQDAERIRGRLKHKNIACLHVLWGLLRNAPREAVILFSEEGIHPDWIERLLVAEGEQWV